MNLSQIEQLQNKIKMHLYLVSAHFSSWLSWSSSTHLLYPMVKKFSYVQGIVNKTVLLRAISYAFSAVPPTKGTGQLFEKESNSLSSIYPTRRQLGLQSSGLGAPEERGPAASQEPGSAERAVHWVAPLPPTPAEQGAQPASQGNIKNLSLVMTSLKIFWHFPHAPVMFDLDFSCNFRLVRY